MAIGVRDEVPLGSIEGVVFMAENSKPLAGATVILRPKFDIPDWHSSNRVLQTDKNGAFSIKNIPAGVYTIESYAKAHSMPETAVSIEEGKRIDFNLELSPSAPNLRLNAGQHIFTPNEEPSFTMSGFGSDDDIELSVYRINFDKLTAQGGLGKLLQASYNWNNGMDTSDRSIFQNPETFRHQITRRDVEGSFTEEPRLKQLAPGFYWVAASSANLRTGTWIAVSRIALVVKQADNKLLCFATDIETGKPIPGAKISAHSSDGNVALGITSSDGTALVAYKNAEDSAVVASWQDSKAVASIYGNGDSSDSNIKAFIYTDRPIYRPGDEIHYKVIFRKLVGQDYQIPTGAQATIHVEDVNQNRIHSQTVHVSATGTASGSFTVNSEAITGTYRIQAEIAGQSTTSHIEIASYRKPEYTVSVSGNKDYFIRGDKASVTVSSQYYFGGPVVGAKVEAYVYRAPYWKYRGYDDSEEDFEEYYSDAGEYVTQIEGTTDNEGKANLSFDTGSEGDSVESDYIYTVTASVSDPGGKYYSGEGRVKVVRGEFALFVDTDPYVVSPGDTVSVSALAQGHDGKPVANAVVRITYGYEHWGSGTSTLDKLGEKTVRTNSEGVAKLDVAAPNEGSLKIICSARDRRGNEIADTGYVWVPGESSYQFSRKEGAVSIVLDKKNYAAGDTAKVLVSAGKVSGDALITVEGDGIQKYFVANLSKGFAKVDIPVTRDFAPNVYVCVALVHDKTFHEGHKQLPVDLSKKLLDIKITADKDVYQPRETATYDILATDDAGKPVQAEFSLGIVDESIYAIREDTDDIVSAFYPKRARAVDTYYSFPEIYLGDGDKDVVDATVRERFLDTALWRPSIATDANGKARVSVQLPDNLTTWRATVTGITNDTRVGRALLKITTTKPVVVRLEAPRFFTQKDRIAVSAVIHNSTGSRQEAEVSLDTRGVALEGPSTRRLPVGTDKPEVAVWYVRANDVGDAVLTASVKLRNGESDAMRLRIPVQPFGRLVSENKAGDAKTDPELTVTVHNGYVKGSGTLRVTISPTIASSLLNSLDYLAGYPYGCTEQTMSRFLPTVVVAQTLAQLGLSKPELQAKIPDMISKGYARLEKFQHSDGGWGWWEFDESDAWMTSYVLEGYHRASSAGYPPNKSSQNQAIAWAKRKVSDVLTKNEPLQASELYLLRALALNGQTQFVSNSIVQYSLKDVYDTKRLITLLMIYNSLGAQWQDRRDEVLKRLVNGAQVGASRASWREEWYGVETTAQAVLAIASAKPNHPLLPKAIRWLLLQRYGEAWHSTRDTALTLLAICKYMAANSESAPNYDLELLLNGKPYRQFAVRADTLASDIKVDVPFEELHQGSNRLAFQIKGTGNAYYSVSMRQTVDRGTLAQSLSGKGLRIERSYHNLEVRRLEDGTSRLLPSLRQISSVNAGALVRVVLRITSDSEREFIMIEDPVPAGCEIVEREQPEEEWMWENWWSSTDVRDDKIIFFARRLPSGTSTIEYTLRAEAQGRSAAMPATVLNMYDPDFRASSGQTTLEVRK